MHHDERSTDPHDLSDALKRNIATMERRRREMEQKVGLQARIAQVVTRFIGNMFFVYLHIAIVSCWVAVNTGFLPGVHRFDPSFVLLSTSASVEAIFLSTFVLISQNRMANVSEKRAELDLHISLLAEHEVSRIAALLADISDHLGVEHDRGHEIEEIKKDVSPEAVLNALDVHREAADLENLVPGSREVHAGGNPG